jgi:endonuclease-3 related protein
MAVHRAADSLVLDRRRLRSLYRRLLAAYGPQHWWPAETPFEVMVGAVLTQNTAWTNVERAIGNLRSAARLSPEGVLGMSPDELARCLRPSGYFNVKADRLRAFCSALQAVGGEAGLAALPTPALRHALLAIHGIGPETADDILLYAFERPVFVIDAYTRRLLARTGLATGAEGYEVLRQAFERALGPDVALFNEFHALIVRHAKTACAPRPRCRGCCLAGSCPSATRRV